MVILHNKDEFGTYRDYISNVEKNAVFHEGVPDDYPCIVLSFAYRKPEERIPRYSHQFVYPNHAQQLLEIHKEYKSHL